MASTDLVSFPQGSNALSYSDAAHGDTDGGHSSGHHVADESLVIFFLFGSLGIGGLLREVNKKTGIPYTPMLFLIGGAIGYLHSDLSLFGEAASKISHIDPHGMLLIFLPTLLFESGMNADWHVFKKQFVQIIILAVPAVFVGAVMLAFCIKVVIGYSDEYYTWSSAFMFGSVLSCTDTVAVLALLKEVGAAKKFNCLIEGESLINDGTCMVLLKIASELVKGRSMSMLQATGTFVSLTMGGAVIGIIFGAISAFWIKKIFNDEVLVVNITFISCYLLYFVCENVDLGIPVSGIIALVSLGLFMAAFGKARISTESDHAVHTYWRYIVYVCETTIFVMAGVVVGTKVILGEKEPGALDITFDDYIKLFQLYGCMCVVRFLAIAVFWKILKNQGYGLTWSEVLVLTWGGLRGAIGICFAMIVARDPEYPPTLRHFILFDMSGCALLTLILNATTCGALVRYVGLASTSETKQRVFLGYIEQFLKETKEYEEELKKQPTSSIIDWAKVDVLIGNHSYQKMIDDGYKILNQLSNANKRKILGLPSTSARKNSKANANANEQELMPRNEDGSFADDENTIKEEDDAEEKLIIECRDRFLMALKGEYYHLFEQSQCGPDSFLLLREATDWDLDDDSRPMSSWDFISASFMNPTYVNWMIKMKTWPYVGKYAKNNLLDHLTLVYDVVTNYINAHEEVDELAKKFPFNEYVLQTILEESDRNREMAEDYIRNYLDVSFPEIRKSIYMKKAAYSILVKQREYLNETYNQGQIEEKEFKTLKKTVDKLVYNLSDQMDTWDFPDVKDFIKKLPFFKEITNEEINEILKESVEIAYTADEIIVKEGQKLENIIIITRGSSTENCKDSLRNFKEKKDGGSIISAYNLVNGTGRYLTTVTADCAVYGIVIPVEKIKGYCKKFAIEEYLYRESFYFYTRYFFNELRLFTACNKMTLNDQIVPTFEFKRYRVGAIIDMSNGGIFLKGVASEFNLEGHRANQRERVYSKLSYIAPSLSSYRLKATRTTRVFHFKSVDIINDLISADVAEKEKQRTLSISLEAGFRKASMLTTKKFEKPYQAVEELEIRREASGESHNYTLNVPSTKDNSKSRELAQIDEGDDI